jgi:uncharacterized membrane protein
MYKLILFLIIALLIIPGGFVSAAQSDEEPVVRGVMFWMDGCPHCHYVIDNILPPLQAEYGSQLDITLVELKSAADADRLYAAGAAMGLTPDEIGVPFLIVGERVMMGSDQIPAELPVLIDLYLAEGGVEWPAIRALEGLLPVSSVRPTVAPAIAEAVEEPAAEFSESPPIASVEPDEPVYVDGALVAAVVLFIMITALAFVGGMLLLVRGGTIQPPRWDWLWPAVPILALFGMAVAGYLAYIETQAVAAICGPVGDCNTVQTSSYAKLFGIPIGVIGVVAYAAMLAVWVWGRARDHGLPRWLLLAMTAFGVASSIYLTYLEIFVIRAVCMWCLTSAAIMTALLLVSAAAAAAMLRQSEPLFEQVMG